MTADLVFNKIINLIISKNQRTKTCNFNHSLPIKIRYEQDHYIKNKDLTKIENQRIVAKTVTKWTNDGQIKQPIQPTIRLVYVTADEGRMIYSNFAKTVYHAYTGWKIWNARDLTLMPKLTQKKMFF